ncbi:MAG: hypothetical protein R2712_11900 [Vicinamibacterales bacterium]
MALGAAAACGGGADTAPPVASLAVSLARPQVALGSPVEMTYRFTVAADAPPLGERRVFVHFLDADDELMWTDDHEPPTPTTEWTPGQTVEYTRTMFVGRYPYVGAAKVVAGLYAPGSNERLKLSNEDRGDRSYKVADFELLPQTENIFVVFKDGWHPTETVADGASRTEWQWMKKEATLAFRNPKRDVTLIIQADNPAAGANGAREMNVLIGDEPLGVVPLSAAVSAPVQKIPISAAQLGDADMVEVRLVVDKTFVPALESGNAGGDTRELGARVFHAFVQ